MYFYPFVIQANTGAPLPVWVDHAEKADLEITRGIPEWQTDIRIFGGSYG